MAHYTIDNNSNIDYEYEHGIRRIINIILIPILNTLPTRLRPHISKDRAADEVADHRTSHYALEILYHKGNNVSRPKYPLERIARRIWFNSNSAKAVRNRLRFVRHAITNHLRDRVTSGEKTLHVLSIASGSARAVLESVATIRSEYPDVSFRILLIDKKTDALAYSKQLAQELGLRDDAAVDISWQEGTAETSVKQLYNHGMRFDVVEMVGLLDYFDDEKMISISHHIRTILKPGGMYITANVAPNKEQRFVTKFVDWKMIYRTHTDMHRNLIAAGFPEDNICLTYEPLKIHIISTSYERQK